MDWIVNYDFRKKEREEILLPLISCSVSVRRIDEKEKKYCSYEIN